MIKILNVSNLKAAKSLILLVAAIALSSCARGAPELPPTFADNNQQEIADALGISEEDKAMNCNQIQLEKSQVDADYAQNEKTIRSNRGRNQTVGYFSAFLLPLVVATENDDEAKANLNALQIRKDQLDHLWKIKTCS